MKSGNRDDGWLTGRLYFNREDKRVIIKRSRSEFGYTMNLGNKWTWIFHIIFVIIIVTVIPVILADCTRNIDPISRTGFYFDTVIQITLYDTEDESVLMGALRWRKSMRTYSAQQRKGLMCGRSTMRMGKPSRYRKKPLSCLSQRQTTPTGRKDG